ncbi:MAG: cytochrome c [Xanthobacteraceae bacterium]|nr:cytochrome c [Xanthobacteraceae bacterium]MBV9628670.1 cytochrome c [Xanthobacteraceae bacterium]
MQRISLRFLLRVTVLGAAGVAAGGSDGASRPAGSGGDVRAKIEYCMDCHGRQGQGYHGFLTMPRLAGQTSTYLENQLRAFMEGRRDRNLFINMSRVHGLNPAMRAAVAAQFQQLNPPAFGSAPSNLAAAGAKIYEEGVPEANIPACSACHGPDGTGQGEIPRLAGQVFSYTVRTLSTWNRDRGAASGEQTSAAVMAPIARNLTPNQIAAIAAYVSNLR